MRPPIPFPCLLPALLTLSVTAQAGAWETVSFMSRDGHTPLVAYVATPEGPGPHPAVVLLHGRAGLYSSNVNKACTWVRPGEASPCNATTLTARSKSWAQFWVDRGYVALYVDSFGPRGVAAGFGRGTHDDPAREAVNERTVRPLDGEAALLYLQGRRDVAPQSIGVQGWSNGASTTLNLMARQAAGATPAPGFRFAAAFYPGCGKGAVTARPYRAGAPTTVFLAGEDEEVDPDICRKLLTDAPAGTDKDKVQIIGYEGATHDFDDPGRKHQGVAANRTATEDAQVRMDAQARQMAALPRP